MFFLPRKNVQYLLRAKVEFAMTLHIHTFTHFDCVLVIECIKKRKILQSLLQIILNKIKSKGPDVSALGIGTTIIHFHFYRN